MQTRTAFQARMAEAKKFRDAEHERIEREFWQGVAAELTNGYHGAQADTAVALGYTRDHILKQVKKHAPRKP
jgi:hypothetical protein